MRADIGRLLEECPNERDSLERLAEAPECHAYIHSQTYEKRDDARESSHIWSARIAPSPSNFLSRITHSYMNCPVEPINDGNAR